jgi:hypothetical protein
MTQRSGANTEKDASANATAGAGANPAQASDALTQSTAVALATELASGSSAINVEDYVNQLSASRDGDVDGDANIKAEQAAHVVEELANQKPELLAPHIETFVALLAGSRPQRARPAAIQVAVHSLPILARVAPAKVAKHLKTLQAAFPTAAALSKDGLVRTFVALCVASVTYQKRLIENFELALRTADPEQLPRWVEHILPALKGEPYAQARAVVEQRLNDPQLERGIAQHVADTIGVKLRIAPDRR